ncbi:hypothetical protein ACFX12_012841 [Malus domestica]
MSLTIFYNDTISVFDVPRDKANSIVSSGKSSLWILLADIWNAETGIAESDDEFEDLGIDLRHPGVNASEASGAMEEFLKLGFGVAGKQLRSGAGQWRKCLAQRWLYERCPCDKADIILKLASEGNPNKDAQAALAIDLKLTLHPTEHRMLGAGSDDRFEDLEIDLGPPSVNASEASGVRNFCNWDLEEGDAA